MDTPLNQAQAALLYWAKFACEELEAFHGKHEDCEPPSWLAELRAACNSVEEEGGEAIEP